MLKAPFHKVVIVFMSNENITNDNEASGESFSELISQYERSHKRVDDSGARRLEGTVVAITDDSVLLDIGYKTEGILPRSTFENDPNGVNIGDKLAVSVKGRDAEGYYELTRFNVARPKDWSALERAFAAKSAIVGTVTALIKGGFSVDVGVRAFMPASRSGVREAAEMEKLVAYVESGGPEKDRKKALTDVFWALLNSGEFNLNH